MTFKTQRYNNKVTVLAQINCAKYKTAFKYFIVINSWDSTSYNYSPANTFAQWICVWSRKKKETTLATVCLISRLVSCTTCLLFCLLEWRRLFQKFVCGKEAHRRHHIWRRMKIDTPPDLFWSYSHCVQLLDSPDTFNPVTFCCLNAPVSYLFIAN